MRAIFLGSGDFACPIVTALRDCGWLLAAVTQPDRPAGRNRVPTACPVKTLLAPQGVPVLTPERIGEARDVLAAMKPDVIVVADYGQYIPTSITTLPPLRAINIHPSLLPRYRGAAPIPWAIANGDPVTGVSIQYVERRMDSGDLLAQESFPIGARETAAELEPRLAAEGARMLCALLPRLQAGEVTPVAQDESAATHARKLSASDREMDWRCTADELDRRVRAFSPWPGQSTSTPRGRLKLLAVRAQSGRGEPGAVIEQSAEGPVLGTGAGVLCALRVQPEGRGPMSGADYMRGARGAVGERWGLPMTPPELGH